MAINQPVWVITCYWNNKDGCGAEVEGVYTDKPVAEALYQAMKDAAEKRNAAHPEFTQLHYIMEEVAVKASAR